MTGRASLCRRRIVRRFARAWAIALALLFAAPSPPSLAQEAPAAAPDCQGHDLSQRAASYPQALAWAREARSDWLINGQGLLWRIDKPNAAPSFLFGTIHSTDERAIAIAKTAAAHIVGAKVVATELGGPFDTFALAEMGAAMMVKALARDGDTLAGLASPEDTTLIETNLAARGVNAVMAHHLRAWFLVALTESPACEVARQARALPIVDQVIAQMGKDLGVKVVGLETVAEQTDVLSSMDPSLAATVLVNTARNPDVSDDIYATLLDLYVEGKPGEILPVIDASQILTRQETEAEDEVAQHLLGGRNKIMAERMRPLIEAGGAFVAVGALHLAGKGGLVALLREAGFTVTAVQ
ncbi:TraB/GumN family protein [Methylocapsa sp. S129]|uniref:TraB/GumN family protein n=1 Tax=Methylocapsa sp. S129 TaxID=1641869 RepID=UPI00131DFE02|nr:TraB/GumN family protein [Methylocapsa sp. S129]